jgi:hypothetical protein
LVVMVGEFKEVCSQYLLNDSEENSQKIKEYLGIVMQCCHNVLKKIELKTLEYVNFEELSRKG